MRLDPRLIAIVRQQVEQLKLSNPEIWDDWDEQLIFDCLDGETDLKKLLRLLENQREDALEQVTGVSERIEYHKARKQRFETRELFARNVIFSVLQWADLTKCELPEATLSIRQGTPKVVITNEEEIPAEFMRIKKEPDKTLIKAALADGFASVPGATMSNAEAVLAIRTK